MYKIILAVLFLFTILPAQTKDPDKILEKVIKKFNQVQDYQVDVKVKVDVNFLKVPDMKAKIYYKQPDKIHFDSENFALLPKEGLDFSPVALLKKDHTALYQKEDKIDGHKVAVVKIIPTSDQGDIILSTLWVDRDEDIIRKVESSTKTSGTFLMEFKYDSSPRYPLPVSMVFNFNINEQNMPRMMMGETEPDTKQKNNGKNSTASTRTTGKVYVTYSNYIVNKGIPDKIFTEKNKKQ